MSHPAYVEGIVNICILNIWQTKKKKRKITLGVNNLLKNVHRLKIVREACSQTIENNVSKNLQFTNVQEKNVSKIPQKANV